MRGSGSLVWCVGPEGSGKRDYFDILKVYYLRCKMTIDGLIEGID